MREVSSRLISNTTQRNLHMHCFYMENEYSTGMPSFEFIISARH